MPNDKQDPFDEYAPEPQTAGTPPVPEGAAVVKIEIKAAVDKIKKEAAVDEIEVKGAKYGIGKPRRIITRGRVAKDKSPDNTRE